MLMLIRMRHVSSRLMLPDDSASSHPLQRPFSSLRLLLAPRPDFSGLLLLWVLIMWMCLGEGLGLHVLRPILQAEYLGER